MKKIYKLTVEPITAVHIGTGRKLTPLDYKVMNKPHSIYVRFSSENIIDRAIGDTAKTYELNRINGNMRAYYDFFDKYCDVNKDSMYIAEVTNEFAEKYHANKIKNPLDNSSEVDEIIHSGQSFYPMIPGSSLKGAIRTAILNELINKMPAQKIDVLKNQFEKLPDFKIKSFDATLQDAAFVHGNNAKRDPMRSVAISDCIFECSNNQLVGMMKNISNNHNGSVKYNRFQIFAEVIKGYLLECSKYAEATIRIDEDLQKVNDGVSRHISVDDIIKSCNSFYCKQFREEYDKYYCNKTDHVNIIDSLYDEINDIEQSSKLFIIRVGRWSQCEAMTYHLPFRKPKTSFGKSFGETRTILDYNGQYVPLGWCKCTVNEM